MTRYSVTGWSPRQRPGFELVVSAHKTVAVLGVIGRAEDMHSILDTETTTTMGWLDGWFHERGGRRGRAQVRTPTSGLTYAVTRHGTSRAGDPAPHDHVLVANVVEMLDTKGGFKGLDSAALRDTTEAATMVGRLASAAKAVELGYAIEPDDGPSGNLRHWRIVGVLARCARCSPSALMRSASTWPSPATKDPRPRRRRPPDPGDQAPHRRRRAAARLARRASGAGLGC